VFKRAIVIAFVVFVPAWASGQSADPFTSAIEIAREYQITPNITYLTANNWDAKLDVYRRRDATSPNGSRG
jgi:hypothetical protein